MAALKKFFGNWWVLTILTAVLIALLLCVLLPLVVGFLRPWWVRLICFAVVLLIWGGLAAWRILRARKANDDMADELAKTPPGDVEAQTLAKRLKEALATLKTSSGDRRDYLYSRPWYVIIGPPGAGKTTALLNSGLRFPFAESALQGVGGTRNLDFWFADEAVLVDTAGRYTTQDSDAAVDRDAWKAFLGLLRKNRPLQPINGIMVAISVDELLRADRAQIDLHAAAVRRRLSELRNALEISAPVYVLLTKADLMAGFSEFYDDLDVEGRRAVLGATLPWHAGHKVSADALAQDYDEMAQAVSDRTSKRIQEELDSRRRGLILGFPAQVGGVRARVLRFLDGAFPADAPEGTAALRGFYFTSGVQEGAPLDRILGGMAQVYDAAIPAARPGQGRAYFLNRLLNEVIFPEAGLARSDPKADRRRKGLLTIGYATIAAICALILVGWTFSFFANHALQAKLLKGAEGVTSEVKSSGVDLVEVRETDPDLEASLSILRALRELPRGYADREKHGPGFPLGFGLYQSGHSKAAEGAYKEALQRILLPRILLRLERYIQDNRANGLAIYEPLKAYLMLGGQGPLDPKTIKAWVMNDWETASLPGADRAGVRKELEQHLDALLADKDLGRVWPGRVAPLDGALVQSARASVQGLSLADRAYAILKQSAASSGRAGWRADTVLASGDAASFANGPQVLALTVPYFFTTTGFNAAYQTGLQNVQSSLTNDLWVMGSDVDRNSIKAQMQAVRPGVAALYAKDYIAAWDGVIKALQPGAYFSNPAAFGAFTRTPSPLKLVLLEVRKNTTFGGVTGAAKTSIKSQMMSKLGNVGTVLQQGQDDSSGIDAGQAISSYFKPVQDYVGDGKTPAPLDDFIAAIKSAGSANAAASFAGGGVGGAAAQGQLATETGGVAAAAATAPPALQGFVTSAAQGGKAAAVSTAQGSLSDEYARNILPSCQSAVQDRYPFYANAANEAPIADLLRLFGPNGQFDSFREQRISPLLEISGPIWRWKIDDPVASTLDPTSAEQFENASEIRDVLSSGVPLKIESAGFGGSITAAEISVGGTTYKFDASSPGQRQLIWSVSSLPEAHVVLYEGTKENKRYDFQGPWALFRLFDAARKENAGPTAFKATFGEGAAFATFRVVLPSDKNPFSRGGMWSFRCPAKL